MSDVKAGLFAGEVTEQAPADGALTEKQEGYHWMEWGEDAPATGLVPTSGEYSTNKGYAATQNDWSESSPIFPHPFNDEVWPLITTSVVWKLDREPVFGEDHRHAYNLHGGVKLYLNFVQSGSYHRIQYEVLNSTTTITSSITLRLDHAASGTTGWEWSDWYCISLSYSSVLGGGYVSYVNMSRNEEVVDPLSVIFAEPVDFLDSGIGTQGSSIIWGAQEAFDSNTITSVWTGTLANIFIHNKYIDFSQQENRRKFSGLNGVVYLGESGEIPFGETPLIYMPSGGPWDNRGTAHMGDHPEDFYYNKTVEINTNPPPIAS